MPREWQDLTKMTGSEALVVERVRIVAKDIAIEGSFELPPLARVTLEDQIFIAAFVKTHGSIKQMERIFGVSYPTIKSRLNRLGEAFDFIKVETEESAGDDTLGRLERGEITVEEAVERFSS
jgi:hypothetical protein